MGAKILIIIILATMPFLKTIINDNSKIGLWEINESMFKIAEIAEKLDEKIPKNFTSTKRKKEWVCTRALLKEISGQSKIFYDSSGSPKIYEKFISISHSKKIVAIILSDKNCAIDVQEISEKSKVLLSKFSNKKNLNKKESTTVWSTKECIFKLHKTKKINFKNDIAVETNNIQKNNKVFAVYNNHTYTLNMFTFKKHIIVYL
ncbi:MAG: hypothetical protein CMP71_05925 [Flavobacteriales bacterium]|nr:hypothetical protein [Flavobacteriales bacterium]